MVEKGRLHVSVCAVSPSEVWFEYVWLLHNSDEMQEPYQFRE